MVVEVVGAERSRGEVGRKSKLWKARGCAMMSAG